MDVETVSTLFSVGALIIGAFVIAAILLGAASLASERVAGWQRAVAETIGDQAIWLAWLAALLATLGSLYYSEIANFEPCKLCWFQRIAMYPLAVILGVAAFTKDRKVVRYALPLAGVGALISAYHYLIQHYPDLDAASCSPFSPCTGTYVWEFGFVSIPLMALVFFSAVIVALVYCIAVRRLPIAPELP